MQKQKKEDKVHSQVGTTTPRNLLQHSCSSRSNHGCLMHFKQCMHAVA